MQVSSLDKIEMSLKKKTAPLGFIFVRILMTNYFPIFSNSFVPVCSLTILWLRVSEPVQSMVPTYDLYEKTKIFLSPERKRWAPGATKALQEHIPATLDRGNLMWKIKTLQAAITVIYIWVVKLGVSKHIKNKFWGGGGGNWRENLLFCHYT